MTELKTLAEEVGVNERTLRRAVNEGTLQARRPTPRRLQISAAERQYIRRSWPLLADLRQALRTEHNVRLALLSALPPAVKTGHKATWTSWSRCAIHRSNESPTSA
jgi:AraC-like DNA-binding protein